MPSYISRNVELNVEDPKTRPMEKHGATKIIDNPVKDDIEGSSLLGGKLTDEILDSKKPYNEMIHAVLKMKPRDVHMLKKSAKYFLDNPDELEYNIQGGALEDIASTATSNDLADMLESDFDMTGGDLDDPSNLLTQLALLFNQSNKIEKLLSV